MAMNGFFAGGMAEGMAESRKTGLAERTQEQDVGLRTRGLDIQEKQLNRAAAQDDVKRFDGLINDTMTQAAAIIKEGLAVGKDPESLRKVVAPIVDSAKPLAAKVGRDPAVLDAQVNALLTGATGIQAATASGVAKGTEAAVSQTTAEKILTGNTTTGEPSGFIIDPAKRGEAENKLRDDYGKATKDFITIRDFKDRIDNAKPTGAGDLSLVFSYMKMLDPGSTVREGEFKTASQIAGLPGVIETLRNKVLGQGQLGEAARADIKSAANDIWRKSNERQTALTNQFASLAKRQGLNPKNVIIDPLASALPDPLGIR
jgi:hypothetical protein